MRNYINQINLNNILLIFSFFILSYWYAWSVISSILAGILVVLVPQKIANFYLQKTNKTNPLVVLVLAYKAFILKLITTVVLFMLMFSLLSLDGAVFCFAYVLAQLYRIYSMILLNKETYEI